MIYMGIRAIFSDDRRKAICSVSLRCKSKVEVVMAIGMCKSSPGVSLVPTFPVAQINSQPAIHGQCEAAEGS
eukprot:3185717-Pleurochrysis_carterae.AAC.4